MKKKKIIVIGANHAGTTALKILTMLDRNLDIVTYDKNDNISFLGCGIALWVQGEFKDPQGLFYASPQFLESRGIKVKMRHEVTKVDVQAHTVAVTDLATGKKFSDHYDKLIIAIGSWPIIPPFPGVDFKGIEIVKWFQHAQRVKDIHNDPTVKTVTIIGAGYIGVELADAFCAANKKVVLVDFCQRIMPNYYDKEFTDKVEASMRAQGVSVRTGEAVQEFRGNTTGWVTHVVTNKGEIATDRVLLCVGFSPVTKMFEGQLALSTKNRGAIVVDETFQTSDPDVYAIGDCVEVHNNALGSNSYIALATTAIRSGVIAATNIAGNSKMKSPGFQGSNAISVFGYNLASTGVSEATAQRCHIDYGVVFLEDNDLPEFMHDTKKVICKMVWDKKTRKIIGAQIGGQHNHTETIYFFSLAIAKGLTIDELPAVDLFFLPHFNKPLNFATRLGFKALNFDISSDFKFVV